MQPLPETYPINVIVADQACLVVGGGRVAAHKANGLLRAGARVTIVAPTVDEALVDDPAIEVLRRRYRSSDLEGRRLVITATNSGEVNAQVALDARTVGVLVNSADDPANCDFILPAIARQGDLSIAVSTRGRSPAIATWLKKRFEDEFDSRYQELLDLASEVRQELRSTIGTSELPGWGNALDEAFKLISDGAQDEARRALRSFFGIEDSTTPYVTAEVAR